MYTRDSELLPFPVIEVIARKIAIGYGRPLREARLQAYRLREWMDEPETFADAKAALDRIHACYNARKN
jgi:hypothetical protein